MGTTGEAVGSGLTSHGRLRGGRGRHPVMPRTGGSAAGISRHGKPPVTEAPTGGTTG